MPVRQRGRSAASVAKARGPSFDVDAFLKRHARSLSIALVALASLRIVSTYSVFSHTFDEPAHIACGVEYLDHGVYGYEPQHPPLARVAAALGPYLLGSRSQGTPYGSPNALWVEANAVLARSPNSDAALAAARFGILPFFWIACFVVYWWGKRCFGPAEAVAAVFFFGFLPPILAHAGLATTDMALTAFLAASFLCGLIWIERPTVATAALFGAATGMAVLSKFSTLVFLPACFAIALVWYFLAERPHFPRLLRAAGERLPSLLLAVLAGALLIWAGYRFSFGKVWFTSVRLPAPELFAGIRQVMVHNELGHATYLLGERSRTGFWCFYLVDLAVKTPLAFLILLGLAWRLPFRKQGPYPRAWLPLAFSAGILLVAFFSRINIGIRHILPIYAGLSLLAGPGALAFWEHARARRWMAAAFGALLVWFAGSSLWSHPDYLAYFNELAGSHPENILVDSDLDWGQDMKRLANRLHEAGATEVWFEPMVAAAYERESGMPPIRRMNLVAPMPGWNAVSLTMWKIYRFGLGEANPEIRLWPDWIQQKPERVGKGILLWYFPPN
jgi:hypothetical protein